jgi:hypothetical protein
LYIYSWEYQANIKDYTLVIDVPLHREKHNSAFSPLMEGIINDEKGSDEGI